MRRIFAFGSHRLLAVAAILSLGVTPALAQDVSLDHGTRGVVELETGGTDGISGQVAADLANLLNDGATRRIVPVIGDGALQNMIDLKALKGLDLAIVQADALDQARKQKLVPGVETITYVARLYNEEFHLVAGADVKSVADLRRPESRDRRRRQRHRHHRDPGLRAARHRDPAGEGRAERRAGEARAWRHRRRGARRRPARADPAGA